MSNLMSALTLGHYLTLGAVIFCISVAGIFLNRKNLIVLLMAIERIEQFSAVLQKGGRPADTPVLVVQHGTTPAQHTLHATLADAPERIRAEGIRPPAIVVIGAVAGFGV